VSFRKRLKFESKKQGIAPLSKFLARLGRYGLFALMVVFISVAIGTIGYRLSGDLTWLDSFHMACMILTGMGPVVVLEDPAAKIFSSFYALYSGIAFLSITTVFLAPIIHRVLHILHVESDDDGSEKE